MMAIVVLLIKCIQRAKQTVYWPGYVHDVQDMVECCSICQENSRANPQPAIHPRDVPLYPFQAIGTDLFELHGTHYLLTVDYYSKWVNIPLLTSTREADVIMALDRQFADYGIPEVVYSDNGPQYANSEFSQFAQRLGFRHSTSSPIHIRPAMAKLREVCKRQNRQWKRCSQRVARSQVY